MGMLYELDDIEKRALVMEIKPEIDPVDEARELLSKATPGPWVLYRSKHVEIASANGATDRLKMVAHIYKSGMANGTRYYMPVLANAGLIARSPDLLSALIARIEAQEEDIRFLEARAKRMAEVAAERTRLREENRVMQEALRGVAIMLNTQLTRYEDEPWAQRARAALSPKGEQK